MNRLVLDATSTSAHVQRFIKNTELTELTSQRSAREPLPGFEEELQHLLEQEPAPELEIDTKSDQKRLRNIVEAVEEAAPASRDAFAYQNKLKYKANEDFQFENTKSFQLMTCGSIPNTFKYKSHPNAKTKLKLGILDHSVEENAEIDANGPDDNDLFLEAEEAETESQQTQYHRKEDGETLSKDAADSAELLQNPKFLFPPKPKQLIHEESEHSDDDVPKPPVRTQANKQGNYFLDGAEEAHEGSNQPLASFPQPIAMDLAQVATSTVKGANAPWIPGVLDERWLPPTVHDSDFSSSVRITKRTNESKSININFGGSTGNTIIHNSRADMGTPEWRKANNEYQAKKEQYQFENIFGSTTEDSHSHSPPRLQDHSSGFGKGAHSLSSTNSTPYPSLGTRDADRLALTQEQIKEIIVNANPGSPLKLFSDKYNTFTRHKLSNLLQKVQNNSPAVSGIRPKNVDDIILEDSDSQREQDQEQDHDVKRDSSSEGGSGAGTGTESMAPMSGIGIIPKLPPKRIKTFTKGGAYTEKEFLNNAESVFQNIQAKGFQNIRDITNLSSNVTNNKGTKSFAMSSATTTSTPKVDKISNISDIGDYSSYTSGFEEDDEMVRNEDGYDFVEDSKNNHHSTNNEYTSFDGEGISKDIKYMHLSPRNLKNLQRQLSMDSSYTFDGTASEAAEDLDLEELVDGNFMEHEVPFSGSPVPRRSQVLAQAGRVEVNDRKHNTEVESLKREIERLKYQIGHTQQQSSPTAEASVESMDEITHDTISQANIKWKHTSQLQLHETPVNSPYKGTVDPDIELPVEYSNMVFDVANQKWVNNDDEIGGSLDAIEDLVDDEIEVEKDNTIERNKSSLKSRTASSGKLEVSFQLPNLSMNSEYDNVRGNVTNLSELQDSTFSQTRKRLVNLITEVLVGVLDWHDISDISLTGYELTNLKDLDSFLPNLSSINVSNNSLKYLDGIPRTGLLTMDCSQNSLDNLTSFKQFHDLQNLNVSSNQLTSLDVFSANIHLTVVNASNNKLASIRGLERLSNLVNIDLSGNNLEGIVDFPKGMRNVQVINISDNNIHTIRGLENLTNLRVLIANDNTNLRVISSEGENKMVKKLCVKSCQLVGIPLQCFPNLRVLRIDGNQIHTFNGQLKKLRYLEEISCKSQPVNSLVIREIFQELKSLQSLDLSGNRFDANILRKMENLNVLVLSAMNLSVLPENFGDIFPNIHELNLNFNMLKSIAPLSKLLYLRKLYVISNNIGKIQQIMTGLSKSVRKSLQVLDIRLNSVNIEFYPFVFNQQELEYSQHLKNTANIDVLPIQLETLDDIESFAILYKSLNRSHDEWVDRDSQFIESLRNKTSVEKDRITQRLNYETLLVSFFLNMRKLDGSLITKEKKVLLRNRVM